MSLRDIANKSLKDFDAKKDEIKTSSTGLPAGEYSVVVTSIEHRAFDSGWDAFGSSFQVVEGEHTDQVENVNLSLATKTKSGKDMPDFVLTRNIQFITKLGALLGVEITPADFGKDDTNETDIHEHLAQKMHGKEGTAMILKVIVTPNKKDPSSPYVSYDLAESEQIQNLEVDPKDPFKDQTQAPTVDDKDLPFD